MTRILRSLFLCTTLAACISDSTHDESLHLTGTEEAAVTGANGQPTCTNPKKQLVCHIPPGNPDNAHEICVGLPAVEAHVLNHGDLIGPCDPPDDDPPGGDGDDDPPPSGGGTDVIP